MLKHHEIERIEMLHVEIHYIFAGQMFDIGMNEEIPVQLTPRTIHLLIARIFQLQSI